MEPIFLKPVYKDYLWGGTRLKDELKKDTPYEKTAESWEISANENGNCKLNYDEYFDLASLYSDIRLREKIFGNLSLKYEKFPILIKFIDANKNLSVQIHPDNEYAKRVESSVGKSEIWYIMDAKEDAKIVYGLNQEISKTELLSILKNENEIEKYLNYQKVKPGDCVLIPAGTVHAILNGIFICEIQQNSDITYRLYDWNRVDKNGQKRKLDIDKGIDVLKQTNPEIINYDNKEEQILVRDWFFQTDRINLENYYRSNTTSESFQAINIVDGNMILDNKYNLKSGDSLILPANYGEYQFKGKGRILKTYLKK